MLVEEMIGNDARGDKLEAEKGENGRSINGPR